MVAVKIMIVVVVVEMIKVMVVEVMVMLSEVLLLSLVEVLVYNGGDGDMWFGHEAVGGSGGDGKWHWSFGQRG